MELNACCKQEFEFLQNNGQWYEEYNIIRNLVVKVTEDQQFLEPVLHLRARPCTGFLTPIAFRYLQMPFVLGCFLMVRNYGWDK